MKIAFFVQYSHEAGTYFRWHNLGIALIQLGHHVDVYAGDFNYKAKSRIEVRDGVTYFITPSLFTSRIFGNPSDPFTALYRWLKQPAEQYDVYHLFQPFLQAFLPWNKTRRNKNAAHIFDWDDLWTDGLFNEARSWKDKYTFSIVRKLEKALPSKANATTVCSSFLEKKIPNKRVKLIYNGFWKKKKIEKSIARKKWKLDDDFFYIAYIGKTAGEMDWIKMGLDKLDLELKVKLIICGPAPVLLESLNLLNDSRVLYLGTVSSTAALELAVASDLGLIPLEDSKFNQSRFPIKFFDFLSVGTPVFYSAIGEIAVIGKSITGAFEGSCEKNEWSSQLQTIVKQLMKHPVEINTKELEDECSWISIGHKIEKFYLTLE